ncbi:hypothetical protein ERO13_D04G131350v2 [Gossypium hirsutum]|nr:hypothetical protein ERO13_D04G131350v2 [Gossypium hirsutum]
MSWNMFRFIFITGSSSWSMMAFTAGSHGGRGFHFTVIQSHFFQWMILSYQVFSSS